jgi:hypothetical protein
MKNTHHEAKKKENVKTCGKCVRLYENRKGNDMRDMKSKNRQRDKDVFLTVGGPKREMEAKRTDEMAKKMLFIFCEQNPIFNA